MLVLGVEGEGPAFGVGDNIAGKIVSVALAACETVIACRNGRIALLLRAASESCRICNVEVAVAVTVVQEGLLPSLGAVRLFLGGFQPVQGVVRRKSG